MIEHPDVIPIAVAAAVCIFLAREILEAIRRHNSNARKRHAIRRFIAAECERNDFAIARLLSQMDEVEEALSDGSDIEVEPRRVGTPRLAFRKDEPGFGSSPIPLIHTAALKGYLFDAASLDAELFELMETALNALIEVDHVRNSLIEYISEDPQHLAGFPHYAKRELDAAIDPLRALYFKCTGEPLARNRVR